MERTAAEVLAELGLKFMLKKEQVDVLNRLVKRRHVLALLPTGYGKSLCFVLLPLIMNKVCLALLVVLSTLCVLPIYGNRILLMRCLFTASITFNYVLFYSSLTVIYTGMTKGA